MRKLIFIFSLYFLTNAPVTVYAIGMEFAIGGWNQSMGGDISYRSEDILDLKNDLKYDDEFRMTGRLKLDMPIIPNIYLMATPMEFEGTGTKSADFKFGDTTFKGNTDFYSKLAFHHYDIALYYEIPILQLATLKKANIELGLNLRLIDFEGEVRQDDTDLAESKSCTLPVPMLYAAAFMRPVDAIAAEAELRAITFSGNHFYSLIGRLKLKILGPVFATGGYRYESIVFDEEDVKADVSFNGPFLEVGFQF
ncbi:TIGR04219 family outer membrane beta-barrel protein [Desulfobacterales bacterium HSG2]|nr:TIGR04219 family outer membrane beta-barrel protein [Desulfobacterales bacterium HSG2]